MNSFSNQLTDSLNSGVSIWLNARRQFSDNFIWLQSNELLIYENWENRKPHNTEGYDYISINFNTMQYRFGYWKTTKKDYKNKAICEFSFK